LDHQKFALSAEADFVEVAERAVEAEAGTFAEELRVAEGGVELLFEGGLVAGLGESGEVGLDPITELVFGGGEGGGGSAGVTMFVAVGAEGGEGGGEGGEGEVLSERDVGGDQEESEHQQAAP
jgi:hypothetical protein